MVNKFTKQNFNEEVKNYKGVVLVDFYADWCGFMLIGVVHAK